MRGQCGTVPSAKELIQVRLAHSHRNSLISWQFVRTMMSCLSDWRCVMVPPPNPAAAIGGALRHAFPMDGETRSLHRFADLLARLPARR